ncbi:hypothetical protein GCM10020254_87600 [Streptomyces goshikiensis]
MPDVREYVLKTPPGGVKRYDHEALCDLLKVEDYSRVIFEQGVGREAIVRIYPSNPLMGVRAMTADDLVMDERGRIQIGTYFDGSPSASACSTRARATPSAARCSAPPAPGNPAWSRRS